MELTYIHAESAVRPPEIEVGVTTVYLRRNIVETEREEMDERKSTIFTYEEAQMNKVAANVSALAQGTAMLTVSEETRAFSGGFILKNGRIEVNCTFDALVRSEREQTAGAVAKLLFPET